MSNDLILGIDNGGSHITAGLVDMNGRKVLGNSVIRNKVDRHGTADEILTAWSNTIQLFQQKSATTNIKIGFAMPGPFDYDAGICLIKGFDKYESLYGINIRTALA